MRFKKNVSVLLVLLMILAISAPAFAAVVEFSEVVINVNNGTATVSSTVYGQVYNEQLDGSSVSMVVYDANGTLVDSITYDVIGAVYGSVTHSVYGAVYSKELTPWTIAGLVPGEYTVQYSVYESVYQLGTTFTVAATPAPGGTGGGDPTPTPIPSVVQADGKVLVNVAPVLDTETKIATATISSADYAAALAKAVADSNGVKTVIIDVAKVAGAQNYLVNLPEAALAAGNDDTKVIIKTEFGTATLPSNMFEATTPGAVYGISIGIAAKTGIAQSFLDQIGDRPIIELKAFVNGSAVNWSNPDAPAAISIPYVPTADELKDPEHIVIWYIDGNGNVVSVPSGRYDAATGAVTFTTTYFSKFAVAYVSKTFNDIAGVAWAKKQIEVLASKGIINGTSTTTFAPAANITRADFLHLLVKSLSLSAKSTSNFSDIKAGAHYAETVAIAKKLGITTGVGDNKFDPSSNISREDMMVLAYRALKLVNKAPSGTAADIASYTDKAEISSYAVESISALVNGEIIPGSDNKINPKGKTTRAEAAVLMYRLYNE